MPVPEKRKDPRIKRQYLAQINIYAGGNPTSWETVTLQNLSSGGMLFNYHKYLEPGTLLQAKIVFPPADTPVEIIGKVVRQELAGIIRLTGISFIEINAKQKELIDEFAAKWFTP